MSNRRVVVTGLGVVSCFGNDVQEFYKALCAGKSGIQTIGQFSCEDLVTKFAGIITDFDPGTYIDKKQARRVDKAIAYAMVAGKKALEDAGLPLDQLNQLDLAKAGIIIGSGMGGMATFCDNAIALHEKGSKRVNPFFIPFILTNMCGGLLAMDIGFMGPNYSISTACATANYSIIAAANHIRNGEADLMIAGGVEAPIIPLGVAGFNACKALSTRNDAPEKASRPWDKNRDGFVMGEGAGVLILESLEHALKRGATIYAEYMGGATTCDAYSMTEPRQDGMGVATAIKLALKDANIDIERVNYINAHATSTPAGDMAEINALQQIFKSPEKVAINATKSMIGHALGAAGGLEAVATVMQMKHNRIHPTINLDDPEEGLRFFAPTQAIDYTIDVALSNSFGFGGHNASILFAPFKEGPNG